MVYYDWLLSFSIMLSRLIRQVGAYTGNFIPFHGQIIFHCMDISHFVHLFISEFELFIFNFLVIKNNVTIKLL